MKKFFKGTFITAILIGLIAIAGYYDTHYTKVDCEVIAVTDTGAIIEDPQGRTWYYEGTEFFKNEILTLKMHTNNTDGFVDDDIIEKIEKNS